MSQRESSQLLEACSCNHRGRIGYDPLLGISFVNTKRVSGVPKKGQSAPHNHQDPLPQKRFFTRAFRKRSSSHNASLQYTPSRHPWNPLSFLKGRKAKTTSIIFAPNYDYMADNQQDSS
ncbi:hypothetical protein O181_041323 [Austropuccinia psidii MF-1]|uniref:Uncharacterized protein n=1 Tax=Austropuccinia psidii MF-1 TaxID=1389203 RepID=A0A9Q3HDP4_9BASI|nr:hypothetical protein [Austropuccinia psidii MF-1]